MILSKGRVKFISFFVVATLTYILLGLSSKSISHFITGVLPKGVTTSPIENTKITSLFQPIKVSLDQEVLTAQITVTDKNGQKLTGKLTIEGNEVIFTPTYAFLPNHSYDVSFVGISKEQGPIDKFKFSFSTLDMGEKYWVDVSLLDKHTMRVYKGDKLIREMLASGGKDETPSPLGNFYTQDRGHSFFSPRFGEGATYWVRLINQILIHSVPRDSQWNIKMDEHKKLGLPASHGCIRLADEDAKWFYENIPRGTLVIIHK